MKLKHRNLFRISIFSSCFLLLGFSLFRSINSNTTISGYTKVSTGVGENGESKIYIPIATPKGTIISPKLSFSYNSQGSDGILGQGFMLSGLQTISRVPATMAQDSFLDDIDFDDNDRFALNGERLMVISGNYGANGAEYRTEQNSFTKIISYGTTGSGPQQFKVWTKDGLIIEFGYTSESRIEAQGKTSALIWLVNRVSDRKGNYMTFSYQEDNNNSEYLLDRIDYTGNTSTSLNPYNSVQFIYENRSDTIPKYIAGSKISLTKRLKRIESFDHNTILRSYDIEYLAQPKNERSRISKITECGKNGVCFKPTEFVWTNPQADQGYEKNNSGNRTAHAGGNGNNFLGDFNGDGKTDIAGYAGDGVWDVCLSNGDGFNCNNWSGHNGGNANNTLGDFNGDGKTDMAGFTGSSWHVCLSTGNGFSCSYWVGQNGGNFNNVVGDFNGDGKDDFAGYNGNSTWEVCLSDGAQLNCNDWSAHNGGIGNNIKGDFNGDGKTDLGEYTGNGSWQICLSNGSDFDCNYWKGHHSATTQTITGDFNGDTKTDIAGFLGKGEWHVCLSTGASFSCSIWKGHPNGTASNAVGDFDGDGQSDIITHVEGTSWEVGYSNGDNFRKKILTSHSAGLGNNFLGDFDGDGTTDLMAHSGSNKWHITFADEEEGAIAVNKYGDWHDNSNRIRSVDLNADGLVDILIGPNSSGEWFVLKNTGTNFVDEGAWISGAYGSWNNSSSRIRPVDMNTDGLVDILIGPNSSGEWFVLKNTGTSFVDEGVWISGAYGSWNTSASRIRPMDVNADGYVDILIGPNSSGEWFVLKNTGTNLIDEGAWISGAYGNWNSSPDRIRPMDVNADGLVDIVLGPSSSGNWYVLKNTSTSLVDEGAWISEAYGNWDVASNRINSIDANVDGRPDIIIGPNHSGIWYLLLNKGDSFENKGVWTDSPYGAWADAIKRTYYVDITADGLTDILMGPNSTGKWYLLRNTGNGYVDEGIWAEGYSDWESLATFTRLMDINGEGLPEMVFGPSSEGNWFNMKLSKTSEPTVIESIKNGNNSTTKFTYKPLTDKSIYEKGDTATYPRIDFVSPIHVVASVSMDNGIGGENTVYHKYFDGKYNLHGRGFRGFGKTIKTDSINNIQTTVFYERDYRCISTKVRRTETRLLDGTLLQETDHKSAIKEYGNGVHFSYFSEIESKEYELDGSLVKKKKTNFTYDDYGNPTQITENNNDDYYAVTTNNTYTNTESSWILGRLTHTSVTKQLQNETPITKESTFQYDTDGYLTTETLLPNHSTLNLTTQYTLDAYGNRVSVTQSGADVTTRSDHSTYDSEGRNVITSRNPLNHDISTTYTDGLPATITDVNNLTTSITRDEFGRETESTFLADGTWSKTEYKDCSGNCPEGAIYYVEASASGTGIGRAYFDKLDRTIREESEGFGGQTKIVEKIYNRDGTVQKVSDPYFEGDPIYWTEYEYDIVKRVIKETLPANRTSCYYYDGLTKRVTNPEGQQKTVVHDVMGNIMLSVDHFGHEVSYEYDSDLNQTKLIDAESNQTTVNYNIRGFKTAMTTPNMGTYSYEHNTLGLLTSQTNASGQVLEMEYDLLNRPKKRIELEGITEYFYDPLNGVGNVYQIKVDGILFETHVYDGNGRPSEMIYVRNGQNKNIKYTYNSNGFPETLEYPNGLKTKNVYDNLSYLTEVRNFNTNQLYWQANTRNAFDALTSFTLGNDLITQRNYDLQTGFLEGIQTGTALAATSVQDLNFDYSPTGNLTSREDILLNLSEDFEYDDLNRLTKSTVTGQSSLEINYDVLGNIIFKSDVGQYRYGENGAGPHTLTSVDHSGINNCIYNLQQNVIFTSYNYVSSISNLSTNVQITYGPSRERISMAVTKSGEVNQEKVYVGGIYEEVTDSEGDVTTVCYISGEGGVIAYVSQKESDAEIVTYLHFDHLGSVSVQTTSVGFVSKQYSYDAWGKQRDAITWESLTDPPAIPVMERGFTFHEMLDIDWLILMNARVYSPVLGRFLSPDPFVQFPEDLQSLNRYAYVLNNPLSLTDPTGHFSFKKFIKKHLGTIVGVAISIATYGAGSFIGAVLSGAAAGFGSSFTNAIVNGGGLGDAFKAGLEGAMWGGIRGGIAYGVGELFDGGIFDKADLSDFKILYGLKAALHGVSQGAVTEIQGGEFRHGFLAAAAGELGMSITNGLDIPIEAKFIVSIALGGTTSKLSGGSFANGAFTAAFVAIYNGGNHTDSNSNSSIENVQDFLNVVEYIPFVGTLAGVLNAGIYLANGNYKDALWSAGTAVGNLIGSGAAVKVGSKLIRKGVMKYSNHGNLAKQRDAGHRGTTFFRNEIIKNGKMGFKISDNKPTIYFNHRVGNRNMSVAANPFTKRIFHEAPSVFK